MKSLLFSLAQDSDGKIALAEGFSAREGYSAVRGIEIGPVPQQLLYELPRFPARSGDGECGRGAYDDTCTAGRAPSVVDDEPSVSGRERSGGASLRAGEASCAQALLVYQLRAGRDGLRVAAPPAMQGASFQEHYAAYAGTVVERETLYVEYRPFRHGYRKTRSIRAQHASRM